MQRIPTLDGWRGIAILLVIADHYSSALLTEQRQPWWLWHRGMHGVCLFFVLSGYLITSRLLREQQTNGCIDLRDFYIRRMFRLMPVAWLYLALIASFHISRLELSACIFFFRNFVSIPWPHVITLHFWSLSIEEQFYLFWPTVISLGVLRARRIALMVMLVVATWRAWHWSAVANGPLGNALRTQYWADALMVGCMTAMLLPSLRPYLKRWMLWPAFSGFLYCTVHYGILCPLHESLCIGLMLAVTSTVGPFGLFEWKPLAFLGAISYSLYIWQQLFTLFVGQRWSGLAQSLAALLFVSLASYFCLESPMRRLGHRVSKQLRLSRTRGQTTISVESA